MLSYDRVMDSKLADNASDGGSDHTSAATAQRTVGHPSPDFPMPPSIEFVVPESWRPIGASVIDEMRTRPDIAVAGPDVVDGVRPNLMAKVSRMPAGAVATTSNATDLLSALFSRQRSEDGATDFDHRIHDGESDARPYGVSRYTQNLGEVDVLRLTCVVIVATGPVRHLVIVQGALSPTDAVGQSAIEAAFASLRVSTPDRTRPGDRADA